MQAGQHSCSSKHVHNLSVGQSECDTAAGPIYACSLQCCCTATNASAKESPKKTTNTCRNQRIGLLHYQGRTQQVDSAAGMCLVTVLLLPLLLLLATLWTPGAAQDMQPTSMIVQWPSASRPPLLQAHLVPNAESRLHLHITKRDSQRSQHHDQSLKSSASAAMTGCSSDDETSNSRARRVTAWHRRLLQGRASQQLQQQQQPASKTFVVLQQPAQASSSTQQQQQQQFSKALVQQQQQQQQPADRLTTASAWIGAAAVHHMQAATAAAAAAAAPRGSTNPASSMQGSTRATYTAQGPLPTQAVYTTAKSVPVAAYTGPATQAGSSSSSSYYPQVVATDTATVPDQAGTGASGLTVSTSTPVYGYNPINVSTPLEQTTVQQTGSSDLPGGDSSSVKDALLVAAVLKPRVMVVPVFIGK